MKKTIVLTVIGITSLAAVSLKAGPSVSVGVEVGVPAPPPVVVAAPAPAPVVVESVPDSYVWDGTEYVGVVGTSYFYLGPNHVWLPFDSVRVGRFHEWERAHGDWRSHTIHNESFRGHEEHHDDHHDGHDDHHDHH